MQKHHLRYLSAIPDVVVATGLLAVLGLFGLGVIWRSLRSAPANPGERSATASDAGRSAAANPVESAPVPAPPVSPAPTPHIGLAWLLVLAFAGFFFVAAYVAKLNLFCLPRYFVSILPLVVYGLTHWLTLLASRRVATIALLMTTGWFFMNHDGAFYPELRDNNLALIERTENYRWLVAAQMAVTRAASDLRGDSLLLYGLPEHFFLKHPWMGYASGTPRHGRCVFLPDECPASLRVSDLPDRFYVILDASVLGGRELRAVLREAEADPSRRIRIVTRLVREPQSVGLFEVIRVAGDQKSGTPEGE